MYTIEPIATIKSCFPEKFGIPRQSLLCPSAKGQLILLPPFNKKEAVQGLEHVSHLWITFIFHQHLNKPWKPKVRPPRLGGNKKCGVFATRSSFRPNNIGLSVVKLDYIEYKNEQTSEQKTQQIILHLSGLDLLDGTPVIDIKPYLPYADKVADASNTLAAIAPSILPVIFLQPATDLINSFECSNAKGDSDSVKKLIVEVLQQDPRPAYQEVDSQRIYSMYLYDFDVKWSYRYDELNLLSIYVVDIKYTTLYKDV
jgi:tRNA-Thr(GGU) m(6)t(6)A37 methyltransferase TsaA